jgi:hypothetical protein
MRLECYERMVSYAAQFNHYRRLAFKYGFCPEAYSNLTEAMLEPVCSCQACWDFSRPRGFEYRWPTRGPEQVTALVVANLQGRHPPEVLTRTRFGVVHLWSIASSSPAARFRFAFSG